MKPLLSIVIPCFNTSDKIISFLSLFPFGDHSDCLEFVIVDDCSSDNSYNNLVAFSRKTNLDINVVLNHFNQGPGISRNCGIDKAKGEYITFLDSDDSLDVSFFKNVFPLIQKQYDCIVFDYKIVSTNKKYCSNMMLNGDANPIVSNKDALVFVRGTTWGKVYKTRIIKDNTVLFNDTKRNEDLPFTKTALSFCSNIYHLHKPLYLYWQNPTSLMHNRQLLDKKNAQFAFETISKKVNDSFLEEKEAIFMLEYFYSTALTALETMNKKEWNGYVEEMTNNRYFNLKNRYLKEYPLRIRMFISFISKKLFFITRTFYKLQNRIRKKRGM